MTAGIFISYRRDDTRQAAGRLADDLADRFGASRIFRDIEAIELGVDFAQALNQALADCVVMLVLIGRHWLDIADAQGRRRLDEPRDWIRTEIVTALQRGIRVVPVLVDGVELPGEDALPEDLRPLVRRQVLQLEDARWKADVTRLAETLARLPGLEPRPAPASPAPAPAPAATVAAPPAKSGLWKGIGIGVGGLLLVSILLNAFDGGNTPSPVAPVDTTGAAPAAVLPANATPLAAAPQAVPPAVDVSLAGMWRSADGVETYQFQQSGSQVQIQAFSNGISIGGGAGQFSAGLLQLRLSLTIAGTNLANMDCNLQSSPDVRALAGMCAGPTGAFPVHFVR